MKLIVAGATGYVASEVIRQSLRRPDVTAVVALARTTTPVPADLAADADASKLKSVVVKDYEHYPADVTAELAGADACIWTVAITPSKSSAFPFEEVRRVCQTSTLAGLRAIHAAGPSTPMRFLYMSGSNAERDQSKTPAFKPEYSLMRGATETMVLQYAAEHKGAVDALVAKPGLITSNRIVQDWILAPVIGRVAGVPSISRTALATVMLDQVLSREPIADDTLTNSGMIQMHSGM